VPSNLPSPSVQRTSSQPVGADLSLACPGSSDRERSSFLARGFRKLPSELRPDETDRDTRTPSPTIHPQTGGA
jgi:hypothetical protein